MGLEELEGQLIAGRFRLKKMVGKGGYGAVFEAIQLSVQRRCAVKILLPGRSDDDSMVKRFRAEARITSQLTHPNSVVLYDFGVDEERGYLYLATEYLDGKTLHEVVKKRGVLPVEAVLSIMEQVAGSLEDAHNHGLVHRDVKLKNIMVVHRAGKPDFVKVIDFGIAKALGGEGFAEELTRTGMIVGTPQYMAPEQLQGGEIDGRADQYALALVGYRLLTGHNPFKDDSPMETAMRHITDLPLPLRNYCPELEVSVDFEEAFLKALEKSPSRRFDRIVEFTSALRMARKNSGLEVENSDQVLWDTASPRAAQKKTLILDNPGATTSPGEGGADEEGAEGADEQETTIISQPTMTLETREISARGQQEGKNVVSEPGSAREVGEGQSSVPVQTDKPQKSWSKEEQKATLKVDVTSSDLLELAADEADDAKEVFSLSDLAAPDEEEGSTHLEEDLTARGGPEMTGEISAVTDKQVHSPGTSRGPVPWVLAAVTASLLVGVVAIIAVATVDRSDSATAADAVIERDLDEEVVPALVDARETLPEEVAPTMAEEEGEREAQPGEEEFSEEEGRAEQELETESPETAGELDSEPESPEADQMPVEEEKSSQPVVSQAERRNRRSGSSSARKASPQAEVEEEENTRGAIWAID